MQWQGSSDLFITPDVGECALQEFLVLNSCKHVVAMVAQYGSYYECLMAMIHAWHSHGNFTKSASTRLSNQHGIIISQRNPMEFKPLAYAPAGIFGFSLDSGLGQPSALFTTRRKSTFFRRTRRKLISFFNYLATATGFLPEPQIEASIFTRHPLSMKNREFILAGLAKAGHSHFVSRILMKISDVFGYLAASTKLIHISTLQKVGP